MTLDVLPSNSAPALSDLTTLERAWERGSGDLVVTWPAPRIAPELLFANPEASLFWGAAAETETGIGTAAEFVVGAGAAESRSAQVQHWARRHLANAVHVGLQGQSAVQARAYGGFSFQPGQAQGTTWSEFGDGRFVVPRFRYRFADGEASLSLHVARTERGDLAHWLRSASQLLESIAHGEGQPAHGIGGSIEPLHVEGDVSAPWADKIASILRGVAAGRWTKVVAARSIQLRYGAGIDVSATLRALGQAHPDCTRFAFHFGDATFLGATPERLISKTGRAVQTEALAGTFRLRDSEFAAELLRSPKEHSEHAPVLAEIVGLLSPWCTELSYAAQPDLRTLAHLSHLRSSIAGTLREDRHVLELVERLHPTPAVGGTPTAAALEWIAREEGFERGWYASPVGWFNGDGDGEFDVALRSGVVRGSRAELFAGCGIVAGSEADSEFAETQLKFRSMRAALRVVSQPTPPPRVSG